MKTTSGMTAASPSNGNKSMEDEYNRNDKSMNDLQALIDSVRIDDSLNSAKIEELACAIEQKLNVNSVDKELYLDMAKSFVRFSIKNKQQAEGENQAPMHNHHNSNGNDNYNDSSALSPKKQHSTPFKEHSYRSHLQQQQEQKQQSDDDEDIMAARMDDLTGAVEVVSVTEESPLPSPSSRASQSSPMSSSSSSSPPPPSLSTTQPAPARPSADTSTTPSVTGTANSTPSPHPGQAEDPPTGGRSPIFSQERPTMCRSPIRSPLRSPFFSNSTSSNNDYNVSRGRSPARSRNPNLPRPARSRTPVDRIFGRTPDKKENGSDHRRSVDPSPSRRRSPSPFSRLFRRRKNQNKQEPTDDSSKTNLDSPSAKQMEPTSNARNNEPPSSSSIQDRAMRRPSASTPDNRTPQPVGGRPPLTSTAPSLDPVASYTYSATGTPHREAESTSPSRNGAGTDPSPFRGETEIPPCSTDAETPYNIYTPRKMDLQRSEDDHDDDENDNLPFDEATPYKDAEASTKHYGTPGAESFYSSCGSLEVSIDRLNETSMHGGLGMPMEDSDPRSPMSDNSPPRVIDTSAPGGANPIDPSPTSTASSPSQGSSYHTSSSGNDLEEEEEQHPERPHPGRRPSSSRGDSGDIRYTDGTDLHANAMHFTQSRSRSQFFSRSASNLSDSSPSNGSPEKTRNKRPSWRTKLGFEGRSSKSKNQQDSKPAHESPQSDSATSSESSSSPSSSSGPEVSTYTLGAMGRRQTEPGSSMAASAAFAASMMSPKTPVASLNFDNVASGAAMTGENKPKLRRNTATPFAASAAAAAAAAEVSSTSANPTTSIPAAHGLNAVQFAVDLKAEKSLKNKVARNKRVSATRQRGAPNSHRFNEAAAYGGQGIPSAVSDDTASPRHNNRAADMHYQHKAPRSHLEQSSPCSKARVAPSVSTPHIPKQTASSFAPMDVDDGSGNAQPSPGMKFNLGVGNKHTPSRRANVGRRRDGGQTPRDRYGRPQQPVSTNHNTPGKYHHPTHPHAQSPVKGSVLQSHYASSTPAASGRSDNNINNGNNNNNNNGGVDYQGRHDLVTSIKEEAKALYMAGNYRLSILKYSRAIQMYHTEFVNETKNDLLAVLLSNRAAGWLMIGAGGAAADDCCKALKYISDPASHVLSSDCGPVLQCKLYTRMARALLKQGNPDGAEAAFDKAIETANSSLALCMQLHDKANYELAKQGLSQLVTEATLGKTEAARFRDASNKVSAYCRQASQGTRAAERRNNVEALGQVNLALATASGADYLHEIKIMLLSQLRRWREVASHCERLAAANSKFDEVFTGDVSKLHPYFGIPPAKHLCAGFFGDSKEDDIQGAELKLNSKAVAEAVLRMPHSIIPIYVRALRLEERYPAAEVAVKALEEYVRERAGTYDPHRLRSKFGWIPTEQNKLSRTKHGREKGDELFRNGNFDAAASKYAECLTIDSEGLPTESDGSSAGGRLHAVLHCNRAACLMAVKRFHEAVTECTAALRIHSRYMKALLRRGRCYTRLERYEEAIAEYKRWLELVDEAKKTPINIAVALTPCLFDGPHDVTEDDVTQVKQELDDVTKTKVKAEAAARAEESYRQQRQKWQSESFSNGAGQGDAQRRRDYFYSQPGNRRWDSFADRGPKRSSSNRPNFGKSSSQAGGMGGGASTGHKQHSNFRPGAGGEQNNFRSGTSDQNNNFRGGHSPKSPHPKRNVVERDHYSVLQVRQTATEIEIKKAYRKLALKYHPDKNSDPDAVEEFRRVKLAYEVLNDDAARRKYDAEMRFNRRF